MEIYDTIIQILKVGIGFTVLFVLIFVIIIPLVKSFSEAQAQLNQTSRPGPLSRQQLEEEELEIPASKKDDVSPDKIIDIAKDDPTRTTEVVRNWIHDKKPK